ncbi:glycosyltransferase family 4 protein [Pleurocapsa sp. FMAR1]|uniref:glycosyltransferase family 4 protein n=1 Tax=Pleurocapsa sp. FMAR1 TaxID=3040204 RepID=UPI0029C83838|nr:glycosyltransferase family 4 protein [Pleurocapsa sp. FMAR1]
MRKISKLWSKKTKKLFAEAFRNTTKTSKLVSRKFNLLIITQFYPPDYAATGQLIEELAKHLGEKNVRVKVFTGQPGYAFEKKQASNLEIKDNVQIQRTRITKIWSQRIRGKTLNGLIFTFRSALYLLKNARQNDVILLTTAPPFLLVIGYLANLLFKIDYVCLVYDLYPDAVIELKIISEISFIAKLWNKVNAIVWGKSKKVVVLSETMKKRIVAKHPSLAEKVSIVHNWADADWIKPLAKQNNWFAGQHKINEKFTVLYSGNLGLCHDLDTILGAIKLLKDQPVQFVFIGAGTKHEICRQTVAELNLNNCIFLPYQDRTNLPYSLTACDLALVTIAPGLEGVVAPSKVYGIMAAGKAIAAICEPHSYLRELIDNANCGAYFNNNHSKDLANFIMKLADDSALAAQMGHAGRVYMKQNFIPQIIAQQYCDLLNINVSSERINVNQKHEKADRNIRVT